MESAGTNDEPGAGLPANVSYFTRCHGHWRSALDFRVTDWPAFFRADLLFVDRLRILSLVVLPRVLGRFWMETRVDASAAASRGEVVHETRVVKWGVTMMSSREIVHLDADGCLLVVVGEERLLPFPWLARPLHAAARVDGGARAAHYEIEWMGTTMHQTTVAAENTVTVEQRTAWSLGVQRLERLAEPAAADSDAARVGALRPHGAKRDSASGRGDFSTKGLRPKRSRGKR